MKETILNLGYIYGAFATVYLTNVLMGISQNVFIKKEKFDLNLLLSSITKILTNAIGLVMVAGAFFYIEKGITAFAIQIPPELIEVCSIAAFAMLYVSAFINTVKDVYTKMKDGFNIEVFNCDGEQGFEEEITVGNEVG